MRIGLVLAKTPSYSETFFNSKIKGLMDNGHDVVLFVQHKNSDFKACKVVTSYTIPRHRIYRLFKSISICIALVPYLRRVIRFVTLEKQSGRPFLLRLKHLITNAHMFRYRLDWLHFGFTTMAVQSEHVPKAIGAKMAVSCRGYDMDVYPLKHRNSYDLVWQNVDKVHAISNYMLTKAYQSGLPKKAQAVVIPPAINPLHVKNVSLNTIEVPQAINITTITRLHWIKGLDYTLEALAILKQKGVEFQYRIIGSGEAYEPLRFAVNQMNLDGCVDFLGELSHEETIQKLKDTDIYLQYSISEGFCNAVLEAQASGCLCIVSDGGALPENVVHGKTGWVVPKRQPEYLAKVIREVLRMDEMDLITIRKNARQRVLTMFTVDKQTESFKAFYE